MSSSPRPVPSDDARRLSDEIVELRRYLRDVPPHHGSGTRDALEAGLRRREQELAAARARATDQLPSSTPERDEEAP